MYYVWQERNLNFLSTIQYPPTDSMLIQMHASYIYNNNNNHSICRELCFPFTETFLFGEQYNAERY